MGEYPIVEAIALVLRIRPFRYSAYIINKSYIMELQSRKHFNSQGYKQI
jgi:hypothetical protein